MRDALDPRMQRAIALDDHARLTAVGRREEGGVLSLGDPRQIRQRRHLEIPNVLDERLDRAAAAVVRDDHPKARILTDDVDGHRGRRGMLERVGERLRGDAELRSDSAARWRPPGSPGAA